jgi:pyrimidine deaminase RibD-like protein
MRLFSDQVRSEFMRAALEASRNALPECRPNPPVGCVIVGPSGIVAEGFTGRPGEPHAEAAALARLPPGVRSHELAAFVTLEPCAFHGRTPSCAEALIRHRIRRVYVAVVDPDPRNNGKGLRMLEDAGIDVVLGVLAEEVRSFIAPYLHGADVAAATTRHA